MKGGDIPPRGKAPEKAGDRVRETTRVQLELKPQSFDRLNRLKEAKEAASYSEVVRDALAREELFLDEVAKGGRLFIERADGSRVEIRFL